MINWLNQNAGATLAVLTAVYVLATIVLTVVAIRGASISRQTLEATERLERERSRPYVTVNLVNQPRGVIQMVVENFGKTAAYDVKIQTTPEILILHGGEGVHPPAESEDPHPFIRHGIPFLPPRMLQKNVIALSFKRFKAKYESKRFEGSVSCQDKDGHRYTDPLVIDLSIQEGLHFLTEYEVGKELHGILEVLRKQKS